MATNVLIKSKSDMSRDQLADLLESFAAKIRTGQMTLGDGAGNVDITLPETLRVETEVKDSVKPTRTTRELEIEIEWRVDARGEPAESQRRGGLTSG